jgi:hypothetical protein
MAGKSIKYLVLFYSMYFLGHFGMSMVYRLGPTATVACGIVSCAAIIFTFFKAAGRSEGKKEMHYGIFSGFFLWCFFGEFLEHEGIMAIAVIETLPALAAYMLITSLIVYRGYLPTGTRFALGHFGCVWLLHFILVNQAEVLQVKHPEVFHISIIVTGLIFLLTALFLFFKLIGERSERAFVAHLLLSFIFFWATVETLQVMHIVPDYTYYAYWTKKLSTGSQAPTYTHYLDRKRMDTHYTSRKESFIPVSQKGAPYVSVQALGGVRTGEEVMKSLFQSSDSLKKNIASFKEHFEWENKETQEGVCYLLERFPVPLSMEDFTRKLDETMEQGGREVVDKKTLCKVMEESYVSATVDTFKNLRKKYVQQFKEEKVINRDYYKPESGSLHNVHVFNKVKEKITFVKESYDWEKEETQELACYLLERFPSLLLRGNLIKTVDGKLGEENKNTVDEALFFEAMEETFLVTATVTFDSLIKRYAQQIK